MDRFWSHQAAIFLRLREGKSRDNNSAHDDFDEQQR